MRISAHAHNVNRWFNTLQVENCSGLGTKIAGREKIQRTWRKTLGAGGEPTTDSTHMRRCVQESNPTL